MRNPGGKGLRDDRSILANKPVRRQQRESLQLCAARRWLAVQTRASRANLTPSPFQQAALDLPPRSRKRSRKQE
jgi:hypothetical protein